MLKPRGQNFGIGLVTSGFGLGLGLDPLASALGPFDLGLKFVVSASNFNNM